MKKAWPAMIIRMFLLMPLFLPVAQAQKPGGSLDKVGVAQRRFAIDKPYNWRGEKEHALSVTVWYPANPAAVETPQWIGPPNAPLFSMGRAAPDAALKSSPARFPLILLSHGTGGSAAMMAWIGTVLAAHGYIAAAVNHPGNNALTSYTALGFSTFWERARDLSTVADQLLADPQFGARIDSRRIGAAGFSLGGYTMIEIAGGITEPAAFNEFCNSPRADGICKDPPEFPHLLEQYKDLTEHNADFQESLRHASDSYRDPRVRAVFAIAPAIGPIFPPAGLEKISIPVEIVAGASDTNVPVESSAKYFAAHIPGAKLVILPGGVAHYVFLDSCADAGRKARPMLCSDAPDVDRDAIHAKTCALAVNFFEANLK